MRKNKVPRLNITPKKPKALVLFYSREGTTINNAVFQHLVTNGARSFLVNPIRLIPVRAFNLSVFYRCICEL